VWRRPLSDMVAALDERPSGVPAKIQLDQNYPNPFNPQTVIRSDLSEVADVKVEVYDMLGREVSVLVSGKQEPGRHSVAFEGAGLSSGVYFYRLTAGGVAQTRRMILAK